MWWTRRASYFAPVLLLHRRCAIRCNFTDRAGSSAALRLLRCAATSSEHADLRRIAMLRLAVTRNAALLRRAARPPPRVRLLSTPSEAMEAKLRDELDAVNVTVEDVSGGCGAMYKAYVESPKFAGLNTVKQHKLVQGVLKEEIAEMHGFTLKTAKPQS